MSQLVEQRPTTESGQWRDDWPVAAVATGVAASIWVAATQVAGVDLAVRSGSGTQHVGLASVMVTTLVVALVGGALLRLLVRRTPRGRARWTAVACAVWVASLAGPLGARSLGAGLWLAGLHLAVGTVVLAGLRRARSRDVVA